MVFGHKQGNKLVGSGYSGVNIQQGRAVSLSSDGNTLTFGGNYDNSNIGAVWIFTNINGTWLQQGNKLVGSGYTGTSIFQGGSISLSSDGNTLAIGGSEDNAYIGATWIFV